MSGERNAGRRVWRFAGCEFDESRWRLTVGGEAVDLEIKPLELLLELLSHAGEVVSKDELMEAVWPSTIVVEGSLTTAISKLRKALGDADQQIVQTAPRIGYRLAAEVETSLAPPSAPPELELKAGQSPPGRPQWRLTRRLGASRANEVWLAEHEKTGEPRVFKFAFGPAFLRRLKREATLSRLLRASLGERDDLAPVLEWNFETQPFFLEIAYRGQDLPGWAEEHGGLSALPLETRLELAVQICETVAAAHSVGVLHRDLKPANVLAAPVPEGHWRTVVVDFGDASLVEPELLDAFRITRLGFGETLEPGSAATAGGTLPYLAPEVLAGAAPSTGSDIFALGVMLYQLVAGDFSKPLAAGWEAEVADPLLREDIALAASGDPARRLGAAAELAHRLKTLEARRAEAEVRAHAAERAEALERQLVRARARRPWVAAAVALLAVGMTASGVLFLQARRDRDIARRQTAIAQAVNSFLANDLLARTSPFRSGAAEETLVSAVKQASPQIDRRFAEEPQVAAELHLTIAHALDRRNDWAGARAEYGQAAKLWRAAAGPASQDLRIVRLQEAMMEARSYGDGSLARARAIIAEEAPAIAALKAPRPELAVWLASAEGMAALVGDDIEGAAKGFGAAARAADARPDLFDLGQRLTFRQRLAFTNIRLGKGQEAERLFRQLARDYAALEGPDSGDVLMVRMNLVQALMVQAKHAEAVAEANALYPKLAATLGADNEMTLQLLATRAQSEGALERWDAAIADTRAVHEAAVAKQGPVSFFAVASQADMATSQCHAGRLAEGLKSAEAAYASARRGFAGAALEQGVAYAVADCLILARRYDEADGKLRGIDPVAVAQLAADPDWGANLNLAHAEIDMARGDRDGARRELNAAAPVFAKSTADAFQARRYKALKAALGD
ncbi:winged helix-turn-helix domain-containing protein [Phenylobacterium sp.]|uniref:protein kinase domain-containing protein n=1 Tax=Phenylobacterium sp. TaxID=1871053 RepID=UPI0035B4F898